MVALAAAPSAMALSGADPAGPRPPIAVPEPTGVLLPVLICFAIWGARRSQLANEQDGAREHP